MNYGVRAAALTAALVTALAVGLPRAAIAMGDSPNMPAPPAADDAALLYRFGIQAIEAKEYDRGIALMNEVLRQEPKNANAFNYLGFAYRQKNDLKTAAGYYETALKIDANHRGALEYQGEMFLKMDRPADAQKNQARLKTLCPQGCEELEDLEDAIADYQKAHTHS